MTDELMVGNDRRMLDDAGLDLIFREARTHYAWTDKPVSEELLREVYDLAKWGPTSMNGSPMRVLFLTTDEAKERLLPALAPSNVEKSRTAGAVAIIAYDLAFHDQLPKLAPQADFRSMLDGKTELIQSLATMNGTLQGAYFMIAARALGLDCGPVGGFDAGAVNSEFFADSTWRVNFICNLGYGDPEKTWPRNPRLDFEEAAVVL
jgi:3-hydroxypropanoate dehydrogenase